MSDLDPVRSGPIPTLLLVDDQAKVRLATRRILEAAGFAVRDEQILQHEVLDRGRAFLPKPFRTEALARKVREILDRPG